MSERLSIDALLRTAPVIPVIVIDDVRHAEPLAHALVRGGLPVLEVTLRTPAALDSLRAMTRVPGAIVGAGTVLDAAQYDAAVAAGARFCVSPGLSDMVAVAARASAVPWLPGVATAGEVMRARDAGLRHLKFFPAESSGGAPALKSFAAVFADVTFCPTGGVTLDNAPRYFAAGNVACVGGSWLTPRDALAAQDWPRIEELARAATALRVGR